MQAAGCLGGHRRDERAPPMSESAVASTSALRGGGAGDGYLLNEATGTRGADATSGQQARLWSQAGALLATTEQLAWYR